MYVCLSPVCSSSTAYTSICMKYLLKVWYIIFLVYLKVVKFLIWNTVSLQDGNTVLCSKIISQKWIWVFLNFSYIIPLMYELLYLHKIFMYCVSSQYTYFDMLTYHLAVYNSMLWKCVNMYGYVSLVFENVVEVQLFDFFVIIPVSLVLPTTKLFIFDT